jgi:hypothetical protein
MIALLLAWLLASPAEAASCFGPACHQIKVEAVGGCVWGPSRSRERIDVETRLAQGTVTLALEPADAKKAEERAARPSAPDGRTPGGDPGARRCQRVFAAEEARNQVRRQGRFIPDVPEIEGVAAQCRRTAAAPKAATKLQTFTGCVKPRDITRYEASYLK